MSLIKNALGMPMATELCAQALHEHFNDVKNDLYNVVPDGDGFLHTSKNNADLDGLIEGIYLPDLDFTERSLVPAAQAKNDMFHVVAYVGPISGFDDQDSYYGSAAQGHTFNATLPYAAKIIFSRAANKPVPDPIQTGRFLSFKAIQQRRAMYYGGALVQTLYKYVHEVSGAKRHRPVKNFPLQSAVNFINERGDFQIVLVGETYYQFDLEQRQVLETK